MAVVAPPRSLDRRITAERSARPWGITEWSPDDAGSGSVPGLPPIDPPPPTRGGGGGGGSGGGDGDDGDETRPSRTLPTAVWLMIAAATLAMPAGFVIAAMVDGRV